MKARIDELRRELTARGFDAFIAIQTARYFSGTTAAKSVVISREGAKLICDLLELERAEREGKIRNISAYTPTGAASKRGERTRFRELWQLLGNHLKEIGACAVAFDNISSELLRRLRSTHDAYYRELPELVLELRKIKTGQELAWLRKSAAIAVKGIRCAGELIEAGRTELGIAAEVEYEMRRNGSEGTPFSTIVASGKNSWLPHATVTRKPLRKGELIFVDLGATYKGYASDMTRTFALTPTRTQLKLIGVVRRAQRVALSKVKDGIETGGVDAASRRIVARAGYARFYPHNTGHGIGLDVHEPPSLAPGSKDVLRRGMVVTVEPGIYVPKVGGARWEDVVLVKKNGFGLLTL